MGPDIDDNDARFKAAVMEECLAFVDSIAEVECISDIRWQRSRSAKQEEWVRRRRKPEKVVRFSG